LGDVYHSDGRLNSNDSDLQKVDSVVRGAKGFDTDKAKNRQAGRAGLEVV
jgi:hypothetical protein